MARKSTLNVSDIQIDNWIERELVEEEVQAWVDEFKKEVDRIEAFFQKNLGELKAEFLRLENQYYHNHQIDEEGNSLKPKYKEKRNDSIQADFIDNLIESSENFFD